MNNQAPLIISIFLTLVTISYVFSQEPKIDPGPSDVIIDLGRIHLMNPGGSVFVGEGAGGNFIDWVSLKCNTGIGELALFNNTQGSFNTALGGRAMYSNIAGDFNTTQGCRSLYSNKSGHSNTAIGFEALASNVHGNRSTAIGFRAMHEISTADFDSNSNTYNTAVGYEALYAGGGNQNVAVGDHALYSNQIGNGNTALGANALEDLNPNNSFNFNNNTAVGANAAKGITLTTGITAVGTNAIAYGDGINCTGVGANVMLGCVGNDNTVVGGDALRHLNREGIVGNGNTAVGVRALTSQSRLAPRHSNYNTAIGYEAGQNPSINSDYENSTAIGAGARFFASNVVRIGNTHVESIGGVVDWSVVSDARFKTEFAEDVAGLDFINSLRPVTYRLDQQAIDSWGKENFQAIIGTSTEIDKKADSNQKKMRHSGFIAQEVEASAQKLGYEFSGIDAPKNDQDYYGLRYAAFTVPLVKAVQELSKENDELNMMNENLEVEIKKIKLEMSFRHILYEELSAEYNNLSSKIDQLETLVRKLDSLENEGQDAVVNAPILHKN